MSICFIFVLIFVLEMLIKRFLKIPPFHYKMEIAICFGLFVCKTYKQLWKIRFYKKYSHGDSVKNSMKFFWVFFCYNFSC